MQPPTPTWPWPWRLVASLAIVFHLFALVIAPLSNPPPATRLAQDLANRVRPYLQAMSLDNGYRFFAPDPGPSHLLRYEIASEDGSVIEGTFPDRKTQWPRLLYHRHFMLAETVFAIATPVAEPPPGGFLNREEQEAFEADRERAQVLLRGVSQALLRQHPNANSVRLYSVTHTLPSPEDVLRGMRLDDSRLYLDQFLGEFKAGER